MNEHEQNRRNNLQTLRSLGLSPYDMPEGWPAIAPLSYAIDRCRNDARLSPGESHANAVRASRTFPP
jgi:hypothetical protein